MNNIEEVVNAIFNSYMYNREYRYMIDLCQEVLERVHGFKSSNRTHDGDIIYGFLVLMFGEYGTSPRSGWILYNNEEITACINDLIAVYTFMEEEEEEKNEEDVHQD